MFPGDYTGLRRIIAQVKGIRFGAHHDGPAHELLQNRAVKDHSNYTGYHRALLPYLI
jgi:hypothetical protein